MKYQLLARYVSETLWAIAPGKLAELIGVLAYRAAGHEFTPAEITARIGNGGGSSSIRKQGAIAVVPVRGVLAHRMSALDDSSGGASAESISAQLDQIAADPGIGTIVYDFDSPGGTVPGIQELAAQMFALRGQKTQIAQVNSLAASAAYWLASQCDEIISIPSGTAGSIGVFTAHQDLSKALEQEGIDVTVISAGKYKLEGSPFGPLGDDAKAVLQDRVDTAYGQFVKDVARGRGVSQAAVRDGYGQGRALGAKDAERAGLIDSIGTMDQTIERLVGRKPAAGMKASTAGKCPACSGSGLKPEKYMGDPEGQQTCPDCHGTGKAKAEGEPSELEPSRRQTVPPTEDPDEPHDDDLVARDGAFQHRRRGLL